MTPLTASEVLRKLRERFTSGNSVPVPDVRLTHAEFDVIADRLEADDKAVPVAWVNPDDLHNPNFVGVNAVKVGHESLGKHYTLPLYTHSAQAQPPAASVTDEMVERARSAFVQADDGSTGITDAIRAALLAAQNPNG